MNDLILVDGNSIGFAAQSGKALFAGDRETTAVFGCIRTLRGIRESLSGTIIVLWDGRSWRKDKFPEYKSNRDKADKPYQKKALAEKARYVKQRPDIAKGYRLLGIKQMMAKNMEADDLAGMISIKARSEGRRVWLVTGDRDWLQLVQDGVVWFDPIRERKCTIGTFEEFTGYPDPYAFLQGKAIQGDSVDALPGVGGVGEKGALELIRRFGSMERFLYMTPEDEIATLPKKYRSLLEEDKRERFWRNMELMNLGLPDSRGSHKARPKPEKLVIVNQPFNAEAFKDFCGECAFSSILRDFDNWIKPFI